MTTTTRKNWEEYEEDEKNYEARTEVVKITQPKEIQENGVTKVINQTIQMTKRIFPVRRAVKDRKNIAKFGEVKDIPKGEHKVGDFAIGELIEIETPDSQEKQEIDSVKKIMKINTDTIKQRKQEQELNQIKDEGEEEDKKDELVPKKEKFRFKPTNYEELSIKIANFIPVERDYDGKELSLRDQEDDFRDFISKAIKLEERKDYTLKVLRNKPKTKLLGIAYLQCNSRAKIEEIERLLSDQIYNNAVLDLGKIENAQSKPHGTYVKKF